MCAINSDELNVCNATLLTSIKQFEPCELAKLMPTYNFANLNSFVNEFLTFVLQTEMNFLHFAVLVGIQIFQKSTHLTTLTSYTLCTLKLVYL